jgi:predicted Zn-dependent protease
LAARILTRVALSACCMLLCAPVWCLAAVKGQSPCGPEPKLERNLNQAMYDALQLMDVKKDAKAKRLLDGFANKYPKLRHYRFSYLRGILGYRMKDSMEAERHFADTVALRPCYVTAWRNLAAIYHDLKKPLKAALAMLKAYEYSRPYDPKLLYQAAAFYLVAKKPDKALPLLLRLAQFPMAEKKWLMALIRAHMELRQPSEAELVVQRLLKRYPGEAKLWRLLAGLNLELGRHARALNALEVHYRLKPPDAKGLRNLAGLYRFNKVPLKAAEAYCKSFGKNPRAKQLDTLAGAYLGGQPA